jgi:hypothetical protein
MSPNFVPGLQLSREFYEEIVRPLLDRRFPGLPHAAGLLDSGSEVLGFDDAVSTDHCWGPRLMLFLEPANERRYSWRIRKTLAEELPYEFEGYSTNFSPPDPDDHGTQLPQSVRSGPVNHRVMVQTARGFFKAYLGFDIQRPLEPADWLTFPQQSLRTITSGAIFHDGIGLAPVRERFAWYPHDVWLYLLAAAWARIGQEEHLMGRAGSAGDEIGSALIGARLVRDGMRLCFLMERKYAPYPKWFGTAFKQLDCAESLQPFFLGALGAGSWQEREARLVPAYEYIAAKQNALGLTEPRPEKTRSFFDRPFRVIALNGFAEALKERIQDPDVKRIADRPLIGSLDLFSDNTDLLSNPLWRKKLRELYK